MRQQIWDHGTVLTGECPVSPALDGGVKGHNIRGKYLTGKPRSLGRGASILKFEFALLRRNPRPLRPWMNAERAPFEALKERSRVCFGGFRPLKHVEVPRLRAVTHFGVQARALACGAPLRILD
jgi:hypothetical protein